MSTGAIDVVTTAAPGIRDLLVLGRVKAFEASQLADLIVLDAPAAGHAVAFLQSPAGLRGAVGAGPIATQADDVLEMLADPERCRVMLVTLAEETPVNEVVETAFALEEEIGVALGPVIVNGLVPVPEGLANDFDALVAANAPKISTADIANLRDAAAFRLKWAARQNEQVARLSEALPLAQLHTPYVFTTEPGPAELETLSNALSVDIDALSEDDT
jgi:anion-transporting  ArsA/GET3 family ATPase